MKKILLIALAFCLLAAPAFGSYISNTFRPKTVTMSGDTITPDADTYNFFDIYLNRATTRINMPTGGIPGEPIRFQIRQDMTGGREVVWGDKDDNTGLTCTLTKGVDPAVTITVTAGTFDFSTLSSGAGRKSYLMMGGWAQNPMNISGVRISSFDEGAGTITFNHAFYDSTSDVTGDTGVSISVKNPFYFFNETDNTWQGQYPFGVTLYEYYDSNADGSGSMVKMGVYSNVARTRAKVRFEEQLTDDFVNGSDNGLLNWREANSNGNVGVSSADVDADHPGQLIMSLDSGISADCRASTNLGNDQFMLGDMRVDMEGIVKFNANAFGTADVTYYFGWSDANQFQAAADGIMIEVVADGAGNGRVWTVEEDSGVRTTYDTGIDLPEDGWVILHIGVDSNDGSICFAVNDIKVYSGNVSNVGIDQKLTCGFASYYDYTGTPLPNAKQWFIDAFSLKYRMDNDRI